MLQLDPPCQCHPEVHPKCLLSTKKFARKKQKMSKTAKKDDFVHQNCPLRKCFFFTFSPIHLVALSESFVLDPKTLIWESVFMEIWEEQYRPFSEFLAKTSIFLPIQIWSKWSLKIAPQLRVLWSKCIKPTLKCTDWGPISTYWFWSRCYGSARNVAAKFVKNRIFGCFQKMWKMAYFKAKNLCDKSLKIKNLRWQFSCIFRALHIGIFHF